MRIRLAAWSLAAALAGTAFAGPAFACSTVAGVRLDDCRKAPKDDKGKTPKTRGSESSPRTKPKLRSSPSAERQLLGMINADRTDRGLSALSVDERALDAARSQAFAMGREGRMYHNPKMRTASGRRSLGLPTDSGENVGVGQYVRSLHDAFMDSGGHRGQILAGAYRGVGIAVVSDGDSLWVSEVFIGSRTRKAGYAPAIAPGAVAPRRPTDREYAATGSVRSQEPVAAPNNVDPEGPSLLGVRPVSFEQPFPWLAATPTIGLLLWLGMRRRNRRAAWA